MARYIGIDAHAASCTLAVMGPSGKHLGCHVMETKANVLVELLKTIPRPRYICLEEGTHSSWLYEVLAPHVDETVVAGLSERRGPIGPKDDERDAFSLADKLRTNSIETRVFKDVGRYGKLRELARVYGMQVGDSVRVQNRIRSLYRSRGIETPGDGVYDVQRRTEWIAKLPNKVQPVAQLLTQEYDAIEQLRSDAEKQLRTEARRHPITKTLATIPGIGPLRAAQLVPIIVSPHRLRTKRQLWKYAGLGIVMRSSSDWVQDHSGGWHRQTVQQTRGLNRRHNTTLKTIFKGAATTVIGRADSSCPLYQHYTSLVQNKTKPNLAKVTIARQIAAITLALWKKEEAYVAAKVKKTS